MVSTLRPKRLFPALTLRSVASLPSSEASRPLPLAVVIKGRLPSPPPSPNTLPEQALLKALAHQIELGYVRGVQAALDRIVSADARHADYVAPLRALLQEFQLETMSTLVKKDLRNSHAA